ncbi:MAG: deoxyribodipyrimidine photo-lyase [Rhodocyclaceae bacterium]|jgi:deoxyribodipyrimidine photo-lyase|nr:deoxyribodipyrimidine photo-lyase [Rhodocyclaceae bacterium]
MGNDPAALVWFRRDLRDFDHAALAAALRGAARVYCVFVFDTDILAGLPKDDRRVDFIHRAVRELDAALKAKGGGLIVRHGRAVEEIPRLAAELGVASVHANRDHEPLARARDAAVAAALAADGRAFIDHKDQTLFERDEILTRAGAPFAVFTPYARAWRARLRPADLAEHDCTPRPGQLAVPRAVSPAPTLEEIGFAPTDLRVPAGMGGGARLFEDFLTRIDRYHLTRDFPAVKGVSYLSPHLRFGTVSIRRLAAAAWERSLMPDGAGAAAWLDELIWREFYQMILWHRPDVVDHCYKREFDALVWDEAPDLFAAWQEGRTGYPLVDAAQRQLLQTGWMHNRLRMVSASFLTKDLGIDWRLGEAHFARWLLDYELASNNGGWQWAAGTGCDAQPWFRIFNPVTQAEKFDPQGKFIRRYVPELAGVPDEYIHAPWKMPAPPAGYPAPLVDHAVARARTLARFKIESTQSRVNPPS